MAIFLYYDKQGKLLELVNDDTVRLGNNNTNTIYFYIDEEPNFTSKTITFERSDGTKSNEYAITDSASLSLPYSKSFVIKCHIKLAIKEAKTPVKIP